MKTKTDSQGTTSHATSSEIFLIERGWNFTDVTGVLEKEGIFCDLNEIPDPYNILKGRTYECLLNNEDITYNDIK